MSQKTNHENALGLPKDRPEGLERRTKVIVLKLKGSTKEYRVNKDRVVIGSVISADVRVEGEGISPIHAVLENADNRNGIVYDLASDSGVYVSGKKIVTHLLSSGDVLTIGRLSFEFSIEDLDFLTGSQRGGAQAHGEQNVRPEFTKLLDGTTLFFDPKEDYKPLILEDERFVEDIFDYRPTSKKALEVIMAWNPLRSQGQSGDGGIILDVEHFTKEKSVTIGQKQNSDFGIPPLLSEKRYAIVERQGDSFSLNLSTEMSGVLQHKGQLTSFDAWRKQGGSSKIPLGQEDFAKVSVGDIDFYMSYTAAPPKLKRRGWEKDALFYKLLATSLLFTGLFIGAISRVHVPDQMDAEQIPERLATILYNPQNFNKPKPKVIEIPQPKIETPIVAKKEVVKPPEPVIKPKETIKVELTPQKIEPKPIPEKMKMVEQKKDTQTALVAKNKGGDSKSQKEAKEGEGARAKGKEGARGAKNASPGQTKQDAALRPSPQGGAGKGAGNSQVADEGNIDFLKGAGAKIQDLLGNTGENLGKGGEKLKGFGGFTTKGDGGLALQGGGKGGGGTAETTLGGLGNKGTGGGRVGTGKGAAGSGAGIVGGQARVALRTGGAEEAVVMGSIDKDAILAALLAHKDEFRLCYEREINAETPTAAGTVKPSWVIGSSGRVTQASIDSSTLGNATVERCVLTVIRRIQFPIPEGAGNVQVTFPFKFSPTGA